MRYIHAFGTLALASVVMLGATFRAEAAYRKGKLLWKCEFTQADVEKYGLGKYRIGKDGTGCEVRPSEGKNGALCFVGHSKVKIAPDVKLDGLIYVESDVMGLDVAQTDPEARDSRLGPAVIMNYIRYKKSRGKDVEKWCFATIPSGSFAWRKVMFVEGLPADARNIVLSLGLREATGEFRVDAVRIYSAEEVPDEAVEAPFNEEAAKLPRGRFRSRPNPRALRGVNFFRSVEKIGSRMPLVDESGAQDMDKLAGWGVNIVRTWIQPRGSDWSTEEEYFKVLAKEIDYADRMTAEAEKRGIWSVIVLGSCPGFKNTKENSAFITKDFRAEVLVKVWQMIAKRFAGRPLVYGYDVMNEPGVPQAQWNEIFKTVADAIRNIDVKTPVVTESISRYWPKEMNVIYSEHPYQPHAVTHQGAGGRKLRYSYPGYIDGVYWDKEQMRLSRKNLVQFCAEHPDARILVGEFSCILWARGAEKWIADAISLYEEYGWDWCYHCYGSSFAGWNVEVDHDANYSVGKWVVPENGDTARKKALLDGLSRNLKK